MDAFLADVVGYAASNRLEASAAVSGLLCVWLLMRQSLWTWPLGLYYAIVSVYLFVGAGLPGQVCLHIYFIVMNAYGWYHWARGDAETDGGLVVTRTDERTLLTLLAVAVVGVGVLAAVFDHFTGSTLPYLDFSLTVLSVAAMWLQARKKLESWVIWIVVDVAYVGLFYATSSYFYLVLYFVYVPMAIGGYVAWRNALVAARAAPR